MEAVWHYNQTMFVPGGNSFRIFKVVGEEIIDGKLCRIVIGTCQCSEYESPHYMYQDGEKIYRYNEESGEFTLLYDFTLVPGDTMSYHSEATGDTYYLLDSITNLISGNETLRVQHFTLLEGWADIGQRVYERIGSNWCLVPQLGNCDPNTGPLRCYEDSLVGLIKFLPENLECDYVTGTLDLNVPTLVLYPNPATNVVTIEASDIISVIQLIDLSGNTLLIETCEIEYCMLDIQQYAPGMIFLKITFKDGSLVVRKVIIAK